MTSYERLMDALRSLAGDLRRKAAMESRGWRHAWVDAAIAVENIVAVEERIAALAKVEPAPVAPCRCGDRASKHFTPDGMTPSGCAECPCPGYVPESAPRVCLWTGKDASGQTRYCTLPDDHQGGHSDGLMIWVGGAPHPSREPAPEPAPLPTGCQHPEHARFVLSGRQPLLLCNVCGAEYWGIDEGRGKGWQPGREPAPRAGITVTLRELPPEFSPIVTEPEDAEPAPRCEHANVTREPMHGRRVCRDCGAVAHDIRPEGTPEWQPASKCERCGGTGVVHVHEYGLPASVSMDCPECGTGRAKGDV